MSIKVQSINLSESEILSRFSHMEEKFPRREGRNYFPSLDFHLNYYDDRKGAIREEANKMIEFVGLGTYRSNVVFTKLDGAAGNIVLNDNMIAEITIDEDVANSLDAVMATLAHEICHKVLHKHGIYFKLFVEQENEVYADLATFYVGFGDLTMKGYKIDNHLMGYLTPETYAMAYVLMTVINQNVEYSIDLLPLHAKEEIYKAKKRCGLIKTKFGLLNKNNLNELFSETYSGIRELSEFYDLLLAAIPGIQENISSLSRNFSNAFYGFDIKDLEWHKFSIAFHAFIFFCPNSENNIVLQKYRDNFVPAFYNIYRAMNASGSLSKFEGIERHCPTCGYLVNQKLESREYHLICPKCKTHFTIDGDLNRIMNKAKISADDLTKKEMDAVIENKQLKLENKRLEDELECLKSMSLFNIIKNKFLSWLQKPHNKNTE